MSQKTTVSVRPIVDWREAYRAALATQGKEPQGKMPSMQWRVRSLMAEHSQVKLVMYCVSFKSLMQWIGVHLLRHPFIYPFIHSQRIDRDQHDYIMEVVNEIMKILEDDIKNDPDFNPRNWLPQGTANDHDFYMNAQTFVNISRKRLCACASKETREVWQLVKDAMKEADPAIYHCMVRQCVYRSRCPEMRPACRYAESKAFKEEYEHYWSVTFSEQLKQKEYDNISGN